MTTAIGIDLGTTFSVVAHVMDNGILDVLRNDSDEILTPSVVHFESAHVVTVGSEAKQAGPIAPERVVAAIKRHMGTDFTLDFDGVLYRPEAISALILRALAESAAAALGVRPHELCAVVTVPAYFGTAEREATAAAARIAGLTILDLVAEPVAAALSYGVSSEAQGSVIVYDLGGGTFDATVIELTPDGPRVIAVDGASQLGGLNFDECLGALLMDRYVRMTYDEEAFDDDGFLIRTYAEAEDMKKRLSRTASASLVMGREGRTVKITVTRQEFEAATRALVDETLRIVDRVVDSATALGAPAPGQVLLTGGSTRVPAIATALESHLGIPVRLNDPDTAVAKGAAIHCTALAPRSHTTERRRLLAGTGGAARVLGSAPVRSVVPRALGIKIHDSNDPSGQRVFVRHLILPNTPLPVTGAKATFATVVDRQSRVRVELMEQAGSVAAEEVEFNRRVLNGELSGLPEGLPAGSPIDLTLSIGTDGRIACVARERSSGRELMLESYVDGVSDSRETEALRHVVSALTVRS